MDARYFSDKIVKWYVNNRRPLPWRDTTDPYHIWLSEVILQQTRVNQGLPYYMKFIRKYPSISHLAKAPEQQVLRLWQGLGYYTRARNLHKCAKVIVSRHEGRFPAAFSELRRLPGIGDYTAAAIASFSFGEAVPVIDGNVFRVLSRTFGVDIPINCPQGKAAFSRLAHTVLSKKDPALHNQAVMELGALVCTPKNPACHHCPFKDGCLAYRHNLTALLPAKNKAKKSRKRYFFYLVFENNRSLLMKKRVEKDIWHGLFDFVLIEKNKPVTPARVIAENRKWFQHAATVQVSKSYKHMLTHQTILCRFIHVQTTAAWSPEDDAMAFYSPRQVAALPKPALISRFLDEQKRD